MAPYEALFGHKARIGITSGQLPPELLKTLSTEEELLAILKENNLADYEKMKLDIQRI